MPPIDQLPMFMRHPILSTFRCYMRSDYSGKKTTPKLSWLKSCVGEQRLYFSVSRTPNHNLDGRINLSLASIYVR